MKLLSEPSRSDFPPNIGLRKSLTGKPVTSLQQLMDRVDKYINNSNSNSKEKGKLSLSLKKGENLGRTDTIITGREGIIMSSRYQVTAK